MKRRHRLTRQAQTILYRPDVDAQKQHRTVWCHRHVRNEGGMRVFRNLIGHKARLGDVKTCGSVWACPVCASKVAEVRRQELSAAMVAHQAAGGGAYLLTFTFPHYVGQRLDELMPMFEKARQAFQNCRAWKALMAKPTEKKPIGGTANRVGHVNSLEVTYGAGNGWHPHLHMLVFCDMGAFREGEPNERGQLTSPAIEHLQGEWVRLLEKNGLVDGNNRTWAQQYALDVRGGAKAAEYIAKWGHEEKWGLSSELTSAHAKLGRRDTWGTSDHYTPFQLLEMSAAGDGHATCAFREFVGEFDGRRMLTWTPGLKKHFGINEVDDDEAAEEPALPLQDEHQVGTLYQAQLQVLVKWGRLGDFLAFVAEFGHLPDGQGLIDDFVSACVREGRGRRGDIMVDRMVIGDRSYFFRPEVVEG